MREKATLSFWFIFITCYVSGSLSYKIGSKTMQVIKTTWKLRHASVYRLSARTTGECRCTWCWTQLCLLFPRAQWNKDLRISRGSREMLLTIGCNLIETLATKNVSSASWGVSIIVSFFIINGPVGWTVERRAENNWHVRKRHMTGDDE